MENLPSGFIRNNRVVATLAVVASIVVTTSSFGQNDDLKDKVYTTLQMLKNMLKNFNFNEKSKTL